MSETQQTTATTEQQVAPQTEPQQQPQQQAPTAPKYTITHSDMPQMDNNDAATSTDDAGQKTKGEEPGKQESAPDATTKNAADDASAEPSQLRQGRLQKRIDRLTKEKNDALRKVAELEGKTSGTGNAADDESGEPDVSDYDTYDDYLKARDDWRDKQKAGKADAQKPQGDEVSPEFKDALEDVLESFNEARPKYSDFDEVALKQPKDGGPVITPSMVQVLASTDNPADIAYYLGKHVNESVSISEMSEKDQARAIFKIEAKLATKSTEITKKTSSAPPPINPLSGAGANAPRKLSDARSHSEYREIKRELDAQNKGREGWI